MVHMDSKQTSWVSVGARSVVLSIAVGCLVSSARADVRLPRVFADHMVLQRDRQARIWGWAKPGEKVTVQFDAQSASAAADKDGKWAAELAPMKANATP